MFIAYLVVGIAVGLISAVATLVAGGSFFAVFVAYALGGSLGAALSAVALALRRPDRIEQVIPSLEKAQGASYPAE